MWTKPDQADQYWNAYSYTGGNPINMVDPVGLASVSYGSGENTITIEVEPDILGSVIIGTPAGSTGSISGGTGTQGTGTQGTGTQGTGTQGTGTQSTGTQGTGTQGTGTQGTGTQGTGTQGTGTQGTGTQGTGTQGTGTSGTAGGSPWGSPGGHPGGSLTGSGVAINSNPWPHKSFYHGHGWIELQARQNLFHQPSFNASLNALVSNKGATSKMVSPKTQ